MRLLFFYGGGYEKNGIQYAQLLRYTYITYLLYLPYIHYIPLYPLYIYTIYTYRCPPSCDINQINWYYYDLSNQKLQILSKSNYMYKSLIFIQNGTGNGTELSVKDMVDLPKPNF